MAAREMDAVGRNCPLCFVPWPGRFSGILRWDEPPAGPYGMPSLPYTSSRASNETKGKNETKHEIVAIRE
jgi:hypothetical protein